jgi:hypothetical protein
VSPETQELLALFAEVAIGTVALSGITMVLVMSRQEQSERQTGLVAAQLAMAFAVVVASILPMLLARYLIPEQQVWMLSSGGYLAIIIALQFLRLLPGSSFPKVSGRAAIIVVMPGVSGLFLLAANLWFRADWPYLTQLLIALATSMVLYLYFVLTVLSQEQESI